MALRAIQAYSKRGAVLQIQGSSIVVGVSEIMYCHYRIRLPIW